MPEKAVRRHAPLPVLSAPGGQRWLDENEARALLDELTTLAGDDVSPEDRLDIRRAAALVEFGLETGTGISVAPPS